MPPFLIRGALNYLRETLYGCAGLATLPLRGVPYNIAPDIYAVLTIGFFWEEEVAKATPCNPQVFIYYILYIET